MASWLKADGTIEEVQPKNGRDFMLEELKRFVDSGAPNSYIEIIKPGLAGYEDLLMVINEEGKLYGLPVNQRATEIYAYVPMDEATKAAYRASGVIFMDDYGAPGNAAEIVGDVLLCKNSEVN